MVGDGTSDRFDQNMKTNEKAVMCATGKAYRHGVHVGRESWEMSYIITIPFYVIWVRGSVRVHLKPAPEVTGVHGPNSRTRCPSAVKKIIRPTGVKDCLVRVKSNLC